ncbi:hypothetical protein [Argonema galeatum]|nr:hypothetical protein [Argonema galeatum]MCL1464987.1 hypothetical protein [Argonema galeatum A003/A1]
MDLRLAEKSVIFYVATAIAPATAEAMAEVSAVPKSHQAAVSAALRVS